MFPTFQMFILHTVSGLQLVLTKPDFLIWLGRQVFCAPTFFLSTGTLNHLPLRGTSELNCLVTGCKKCVEEAGLVNAALSAHACRMHRLCQSFQKASLLFQLKFSKLSFKA